MSENNKDGSYHPKGKVVKKLLRLNHKYVLTSFVIILMLGANVLFSSKFEKVPDLTALMATSVNAANALPSYEKISSLKKHSTYTWFEDYCQPTIYANNTPVWISLSPNAYAYHKTYSCAANRTKYEVIKVTTKEAREKYHRSPCKICQPK